MSKYFTITILAILFLLPQAVDAAGLVPCGGPPPEEPCNICHIFQLLQTIIQGAMIAILAWAGMFILIGGIIILASAGSAEQASKGKKTITYAIIGIIVAFGSWMIINMIMNALVNPDVMPWKFWNKIECEPTEPLFTHKECIEGVCKEVEGAGTDQCITIGAVCGEVAEGKICRCEWSDDTVKTNEYSSPEECKAQCKTYCGDVTFLDRYCCVENASDECEGSIIGSEKKHCIGEIPVYTIDPHNYSDKTQVIGREFKGTELASEEECTQKCAFPGGYIYLPQRNLTDASEGNLYCASQNELEKKAAHCIELRTKTDYLRDFSAEQACIDSVLPEKSGFDKECARMCWVDGNLYCDCQKRDPVYQLRRIKKEEGVGMQNTTWACVRNCGITSGENCRLGSYQEPSGCEAEEDLCVTMNPPLGQKASCLGGNFTCQQGVIDQYSDACSELKQFLTCMAGKNLSAAAKEISSISDNSPNPLGGALPGCFSEWKATCSSGTDSCAGTCCGHGEDSLHYGGKFSKKDVIGCRDCSWAVDFANENSKDELEKAAKECADTLEYGKVDVVPEGNHIHIELDNVARNWYRCM